MSALGGILNFESKPVERHELAALEHGLAPHGPDNSGESLRGCVGMTYRAFHTTKESWNESQPLVSRQGQILCWDGRLDNRDDLIRILRAEIVGNHTDVAIVMAAYRRWGPTFLAQLIGDFALSLWDENTRILLLGRDHAGSRPLFYHIDRNKIIWSSDLGPLVDLEGIELTPDDKYVARFLSHSLTLDLTPYKLIHAVVPGHSVAVQNDHLRTHRFWRPNPSFKIRYKTDSEYEEHFRHLFREAVRCRMRSDGPIWASLSGGLDSSAIVCVADEVLKSGEAQTIKVETVSYVYDQSTSSDERNFISCVEQKRGRLGHHVRESECPLLTEFPDASEIFYPDGGDCFNTRYKALAEAMSADRARVLLTGHGGDEMLSGGGIGDPYPELGDLIFQRRPLKLHRALCNWSEALKKPYSKLFWQSGIVPLLPTNLRRLLDKRPYRKLPVWFDKEFVRRFRLKEANLSFDDTFGFTLPSERGQVIWYLFAVQLISRTQYRQRSFIEVAHPYLHRPLVEFFHAIPHDQKIRPTETRSLMRRALRETLPEKIFNRRTKRGPDEAYLRAIAREWTQIEKLFLDARVGAYGYIDVKNLMMAFERARHGCQDSTLLAAISLELWLRALECRVSKPKKIAATELSVSSAAAIPQLVA